MFSKEELTILSEEEVFGWTEEEQVILNVLMKAEVQGNFRGNRLSVFDKAENIRTPITDLVKLTGGNFSYEDKNLAEFVYTKSCDKKGNVRTFGNNGGRWSAISSDAQGTIRPVLRSNEVYLDLLNLPHSEDFEEVEYGEYPQYAASIEMQDVLENAYKNNELRDTNGAFSINNLSYFNKGFPRYTSYPVYEYEGTKYIRMKVMPNNQDIVLSNGQELGFSVHDQYVWLEVSPVKWLLDKETKTLVSKNGLISGLDMDYAGRPYNGSFMGTNMYEFLNDRMLKEMTQFRNMEKEKTRVR